MIIWNRTLSVAATLALVLAAIAVSCGGGDGHQQLTLEEYFRQLEATIQDTDARMEALPGAPSPDSTLEEWRSYLNDRLAEHTGIVADFIDELTGLQLPPEVRDAHEDGLVAARELQEQVEEYASRVAEAESKSELEGLGREVSTSVEPIQKRLDEACAALQRIADDNKIDVDLRCTIGSQ